MYTYSHFNKQARDKYAIELVPSLSATPCQINLPGEMIIMTSQEKNLLLAKMMKKNTGFITRLALAHRKIHCRHARISKENFLCLALSSWLFFYEFSNSNGKKY